MIQISHLARTPIPFDRRSSACRMGGHVVDRLAPAAARMDLAQRFWKRFQPRVVVDASGRVGFVSSRTGAPLRHPIGIKPELLLVRQAEAWAAPAAQITEPTPARAGGVA